jgi:Probable Zinc-ribbon domain
MPGMQQAAAFRVGHNSTLGRWRVPRERSFAVLHPELLAEWHAVRNEGLDPFAVGIGSNLRISWCCSQCVGAGGKLTPFCRLKTHPL